MTIAKRRPFGLPFVFKLEKSIISKLTMIKCLNNYFATLMSMFVLLLFV